MRLFACLVVWLLLQLPGSTQDLTLTINTDKPGLDVYEIKADQLVTEPGGRQVPDRVLLCRTNQPYRLPLGGRRHLRVQFAYTLNGWLARPAWDANLPTETIPLAPGGVQVWPESPLDATLDRRSLVLYLICVRFFWWEAAAAAALVALAVAWPTVLAPRRTRRRRAQARKRRLEELQRGFDPSDPWLGRRFGAYRLVAKLGAGGMAAVYRALDDETLEEREPVAVKIMHAQASAEAEERFRREARVCVQLNHPNLVRILDAGDQDGVLYLAMELIEGQTLRCGRNLPPARILELFRSIVAGVEAAHALGIVHRDLKPDNVMVAITGRVVVMDFGLARRNDLATLTATGAIMGTPAYMAPEQIRGEAVDTRLDQYALGVMLYEMLTGALPFEGELDPMQLLMKHLAEAPTPLRERRPELDIRLETAVMRMLRKDPGERFQTLSAAWAALSEGVPQKDAGPVAG